MDAPRPPTLLCSVRNCAAPLSPGERAWACPRGHSFDLARSGYLNLLQPQDRRSRRPGDPPAAVAARRRFLDAGHEAPFLRALVEEAETAAGLVLPERPAVLDVGCGEGTHLAAVASALGGEAHGVDLSTAAIDLAARRHPGATWIVANADRLLPYADGSFDLALSITSRRNPPELRRVIAPAGRLLVAVPGADDLIELREAVLGEGVARDRSERTAEELAGSFVLEGRREVRWAARLGPAELSDLLAATYRGGRESRRRRLEDLGAMEVTLSRDLLTFRPC